MCLVSSDGVRCLCTVPLLLNKVRADVQRLWAGDEVYGKGSFKRSCLVIISHVIHPSHVETLCLKFKISLELELEQGERGGHKVERSSQCYARLVTRGN
jgi:hypothetical protein